MAQGVSTENITSHENVYDNYSNLESNKLRFQQHPYQQFQRWYILEAGRMRHLGLENRLRFLPNFSGDLTTRYVQSARNGREFVSYLSESSSLHDGRIVSARGVCQTNEMTFYPFPNSGDFSNTLAPFCTNEKGTCGVRFSRENDHRKIRHGISPANLPKWRSWEFEINTNSSSSRLKNVAFDTNCWWILYNESIYLLIERFRQCFK